MRYNRKNIMVRAHKLYRSGRFGTFANALRTAWADEKAIVNAVDGLGEVHTWFGWSLLGREVWHEEHAVAKVTVADEKTKKGTRVLSFFTFEQTCEQGEQPYKVA